jgi:hypothetical protein
MPQVSATVSRLSDQFQPAEVASAPICRGVPSRVPALTCRRTNMPPAPERCTLTRSSTSSPFVSARYCRERAKAQPVAGFCHWRGFSQQTSPPSTEQLAPTRTSTPPLPDRWTLTRSTSPSPVASPAGCREQGSLSATPTGRRPVTKQ